LAVGKAAVPDIGLPEMLDPDPTHGLDIGQFNFRCTALNIEYIGFKDKTLIDQVQFSCNHYLSISNIKFASILRLLKMCYLKEAG